MQLRKPQTVCVIHDQSIGVWHVHTGFDDGGADQNVDLTRDHIAPDALQRILVHLTVCNRDPGFGNVA